MPLHCSHGLQTGALHRTAGGDRFAMRCALAAAASQRQPPTGARPGARHRPCARQPAGCAPGRADGAAGSALSGAPRRSDQLTARRAAGGADASYGRARRGSAAVHRGASHQDAASRAAGAARWARCQPVSRSCCCTGSRGAAIAAATATGPWKVSGSAATGNGSGGGGRAAESGE
jgi:hypothetical protein